MNEPVRVENLKPLNQPYLMDEAQLAEYEASYRNDYHAWAQVLSENVERIRRGSYSLHWLNTDGGNWGKRAKPSSRGLTYTDINRVRGYEFDGYERTVDSHVKNLRRKIEPDPTQPTIVQTVTGVGYRMGLDRDR